MKLLTSSVVRNSKFSAITIIIDELKDVPDIDEMEISDITFSVKNNSLYLDEKIITPINSDDLYNSKLTYFHFLAQLKKLRIANELSSELITLLNVLTLTTTPLFEQEKPQHSENSNDDLEDFGDLLDEQDDEQDIEEDEDSDEH